MANETQTQIAKEIATVEVTEVDPKEGLGNNFIRINPYDEYLISFTNFRTEKEHKIIDGNSRHFINWTCDLLKVNGEDVIFDENTQERSKILKVSHADARTKINALLENQPRTGFYSLRLIRSANNGRKAVYMVKDFKVLSVAKDLQN
jgi:hypothetical protein